MVFDVSMATERQPEAPVQADPTNVATNGSSLDEEQYLLLPTLDPGHEAILEMHANSESSALLYVIIVLVLYVFALVVVMMKYLKTERYEARLSRLYDEFVRRDRFLRLSKRRHNEMPVPASQSSDSVKNQKKLTFVDRANQDNSNAESNV